MRDETVSGVGNTPLSGTEPQPEGEQEAALLRQSGFLSFPLQQEYGQSSGLHWCGII